MQLFKYGLWLFTSLSYALPQKGYKIMPPPGPLAVPGGSHLTYCEDPKDYLLNIDKLDMKPNGPRAGEYVYIFANGHLSKEVKKNSTMEISIKQKTGPISFTLFEAQEDFCDQLENIDRTCPLQKGAVDFGNKFMVPAKVPSGSYVLRADVLTEDEEKVVCVEAPLDWGEAPIYMQLRDSFWQSLIGRAGAPNL